MTDQETALRKLLAKGTDASMLREMSGFAAERLMELEVGGMTGAATGSAVPTGWPSATATATAKRTTALSGVRPFMPRPWCGAWCCRTPRCSDHQSARRGSLIAAQLRSGTDGVLTPRDGT